MASVTLNIPSQHVQRVISALCASEGMETSPANAKDAIIRHIKRTVANVEREPPQEPPEPDTDGIVD